MPAWRALAKAAGCAAVVVAATLALVATVGWRGSSQPMINSSLEKARHLSSNEWITDGVNLGSWLHLEDWFFSGENGRFVSTPDSEPGQGHCLPPLLNKLDEPWRSEGGLAFKLNASLGPAMTATIFKAHRETFVAYDDLKAMRDVGLKYVRVPLNWAAFADAIKGVNDRAYRSHDPNKDTVLVPDPFYSSEILLATVPRDFLAKFLRDCASLGLGVVLDMHAFPGGSSWGTFNGITPLEPVFWSESVALEAGGHRNLTDVGLQIIEGLVDWCKGLDETAKSALEGLTMMNEPALFVRPSVEEDVFKWLEDSGDVLRRARLEGSLPNVKLYVNVHEGLMDDWEKWWEVVPAWWHQAFTKEDRFSWVVMDVHYYVAWAPACTGTIDGQTQWGPAAFMCNETEEAMQEVFDGCVDWWAKNFASKFEGLRASTETSAGTWFDSRIACHNAPVTNALGRALANKMRAQNISSHFWSWHMHFGPNYEAGWSLAHLKGKAVRAPASACAR
eukprot:TRINITY_DN100577_c0_g1_i1.p1 TRINITY_DN100577_c0_g1~~TRINITY_DN100577_c0_g1_i1.p1  ORF type:complete len:540 (+),score=58.98 TRINITY_DN100577_c0_g1_i1:111-1622(+)